MPQITTHNQAELLRLYMGMDGCGCAECQEYYKTLDLSKYGSRVKRFGDFVIISAGTTGADLMEAPAHPTDAPLSPSVVQEYVTKSETIEDVAAIIKGFAAQRKSTREIAKLLNMRGKKISHMTVARLLQGILI